MRTGLSVNRVSATYVKNNVKSYVVREIGFGDGRSNRW